MELLTGIVFIILITPFVILFGIQILNQYTIKSEKIDKTITNAQEKWDRWANAYFILIYIGVMFLMFIIMILSLIFGWD